MHIFDIAEIVVIIFPYLTSVDRAKCRLVSPVFNSIYKIEETNELIEKWQNYSRELCYENINSPLSDDELQELMKEFDYPDVQFHLKVWLTKCTRGYTLHEYDLVSVATTDHWETAHSILEQFYCYMPLDNEFGENEWQDRLIIVMNRVPFTLLDKKSGHFYVITDTEYPMVEDKGTIKDWIDSIPIERIGELSFNHVRYDYECNKYVKVMKEGNKKKLVAFLKRYSRFYRFLDEGLRRDPEILDVIKKSWSHDIASSFIPPEIRLDWDKYLDFFRLYKWHSNMHYKFKRDKEYVLKLLKLEVTKQIDHFSIDPKMINDPDISELMVEDSFLEMSDFRAKTKEQWRKLYYNGSISIFSFDREVTKDSSFMVELIAEQTGYHHEGNEYLEDEEAIFKIRNKLILSLVSPKLLNDKQFMLKWYNIDPQASYFIGDSLKTDTEIMTNTNALKYQTGLNLTKLQIVEILNSLYTNSDVYYLMRKCFVKNFIPKDYLQDEEFLLDLIRICPSTSVLINRNLRTNLPFWARVIEINPEVLELGLVPPKLKLEMIKSGLITEEEAVSHQKQEFKHDEKYYEDDDSFDEDEETESDEDEDDEEYWNRPPMKFVRLPSKLSNI